MPAGDKKGILIVDDALFTRTALKKIISKIEQVEVIGEASNGFEAVSLYKKLNPDLVSMDLVMPEKSGIQAIEEIIKFDKKAKILVVSAMGQQASILEAMEKGAKDFIKKPFREEDVLTKIGHLLKRKGKSSSRT
ncbi:hypothetical protein LCGC14_0468170 [marine sediment metagenome]|uniref:Response regulatory domain-containing protein n=1 Tax=marine sediment metagenome TaxID=412755 RepID=A0A0F9SD49_9ZZZZ|nr:MAG: Signal transduction response regulator [Candidatus Lokiarchaeum sp. GC14_75]